MELLGHQNPSNTTIYTEWSREDARAVVERLDVEETRV
jgi:site-specific recombinase XerD